MIRAQIVKKNGKSCICPEFAGTGNKCYEIISADRLYKQIHDGVPLKINGLCIQGFSMSEYRRIYGLAEDDMVSVAIDSVIDCLFCAQGWTAADFSHCNFMAVDDVAGIMLDDNVFYCGEVNFSYSHMGEGDFSMKGCRFIKCEMVFAYTIFGNGDISFEETVFEDKCGIKFSGTDFGEQGEVAFSYMKGLDGAVEFYRCNFGENALDFAYMDCPECQFSFWEIETPAMPVDFVDSVVRMILLYKANINGLLDFRVSLAEHIVIQESVIRDCVLLGNQGYKNYTCYCLKKSTLLGRLKIQNRFSKKLFDKQLQYVYDPRQDEIVLCPTSSTDKANQLTILSENYLSEGETDNADAAYVLSKRYRSRGRIHDLWTDYPAVGRTEIYQKSWLKRLGAYLGISVKLFGAAVSWLFEKIFLDILCGNYATKPAKFLCWIVAIVTGFAGVYYGGLGIDMEHFQMQNALYQSMKGWEVAWIYSLQLFLQIENGDLVPNVLGAYYFMIAEKIIGLAMFSVFVVSYTRKVIK